MTRNLTAAVLALLSAMLMAGLGLAQTKPASFSSKQLSVSNIDPKHFNLQLIEGTFSFRGLPVLRAILPEKHVTLTAARVDGTIDPATRVLRTAKLTGGVKGAMDSNSADGPEHVTFSGSVVNYTNIGGADVQSADIEVSGGVTFGSSNDTVKRTLSLKGSHGVFQLRPTAGVVGLSSADLDGPVTVDFSGTMLNKEKTSKTPLSGKATGGHLTVRPAGTGFVIRMSGGVVLRGITGPLAGAELQTAVINIEVDAKGNFISLGSVADTTASVPTGKHPA